MAGPKLAAEIQAKIRKLAPTTSDYDIAAELGISRSTVCEYRKRYRIPAPKRPSSSARIAATATTEEPALHDSIRRLLKKSPRTTEELADALDCAPKRIHEAIEGMKSRGAMLLKTLDNKHDLGSALLLPTGTGEAKGTEQFWTHHFGFTTDNHLCNRHSRLDVLKAAYDHFAAEGISKVFNAGNWIDGEARFNKTELVTAPGMDHQLDYLIENFPQRKGIVTEFIAGDDHEGWYYQREGIDVGRYLQSRAETAGRTDLKYLGYAEADIKLSYGSGSSVMRLVHPGGGSAYAISYTDQKRVESYQGGEKPAIELVGHYHKFNYGYPREVHTIQGGCTCDQTLFMRKKRLQAHVGFSVIKIRQEKSGVIARVSVEWFPFFDRGFYEKRFMG